MPSDLQTIDPVTGKPPASRIKDAASLNSAIKKLVEYDNPAALNRANVQKMLDGAPPFDQRYLDESGQSGRCNLNFGDGKARIKMEEAGYYDLTESVPTLGMTQSEFGDPMTWAKNNAIMSEGLHKMLKDWDAFDAYHQLLVKKFVSHGLGFLYFPDDLNWQWEVAGLEDFKLPRGTPLIEKKVDMAVVFRDVTVAELYSWIKNVSAGDKRWNLKEVRAAIMKANDGSVFSPLAWEKYQEVLKNNDVFAASTAQDMVHLAHVWTREFSGKVSQFMTLRDGGNEDFLFKCFNRFESVNQCFTYFPYEVGSNGMLHSTRGLGHEIYAPVQVLNSLRNDTVDNAKLCGKVILQPKTENDAQDLAIMFFGGVAYIPPNVTIQTNNLANPSTNILPIIQDMSMMMRRNTGDVNTQDRSASEREKTKFQVQSELTKESVLPVASMNLFYQPWSRHLSEVWRRVQNSDLKASDPGGREVFEFRKWCVNKGVPAKALTESCRIVPVRAVGYGSPSNRLLAVDELMGFYGSLDPVGQNKLLRARFAQRVPYSQLDEFVPPIEQSGRGPVDVEIAELQNAAMSAGVTVTVLPNDHHIIHLQSHLPNLAQGELDALESGQGNEQTLAAAQIKIKHCSGHINLLKPDKLQEKAVAELGRQFNNAAERVSAAMDHAQRQAEKEAVQAPAQTSKLQQTEEQHALKMKMREEDHALKWQLKTDEETQKKAIRDAVGAAQVRSIEEKKRLMTNRT